MAATSSASGGAGITRVTVTRGPAGRATEAAAVEGGVPGEAPSSSEVVVAALVLVVLLGSGFTWSWCAAMPMASSSLQALAGSVGW